MKQTQLEFITIALDKGGEISRNYCLQHFISRLGSRIQDLEEMGWQFRTERREGDYVYVMTKRGNETLKIAPQAERSDKVDRWLAQWKPIDNSDLIREAKLF